ncbi:MAG: RsmB/NOP family class I SAM-dependent RNA methyltransferase [Rhodocyclaceae bacterium]
MKLTSKLIDSAVVALARVLPFRQPADAALSEFFREERALGLRDRAFVAETVYGVLRRKRFLEHLLEGPAKARHLVLMALVRLQGMSQRQIADLLRPGEAGWLAKALAVQVGEPTLAEQVDFPDWLVERLLAGMAEGELLELARGLNQGAPLDLRVNSLKASRADVLAQFAAEGIGAEPCHYAPLGIRLADKPALQRHPLFLDGTIEVQDEGSQLLGYLVAPKRGEMVVDFCAGAGGKTLMLGALMRSAGRLYAFDVADKRLARLRPRVARSGLSNVHPVLINNENDLRVKRLAGKIDRVLVDAPCSGLGTLRRNPDLKWRQTPETVEELARKQHDILCGAARMVKPGGRLVYATCSILPEENDAVVAAFLASHGDFIQRSAGQILEDQRIPLQCGEALRLLPHVHGTDGFFAVVLERVKSAPDSAAKAGAAASADPSV